MGIGYGANVTPHRARVREIPEPPAIPLLHHDVQVVVPGKEAAVVVEADQAPLEYGVPGKGGGDFFQIPTRKASYCNTGWGWWFGSWVGLT